jgi:CDP-glucose 4,6-dehydratase
MGVVDAAFWRGRRVLVTGNTGFKGAWLTLWLLELGADVSGLALAAPTEPSLYELARLADDVPQDTIDVRDATAVRTAVAARAPEIVIHMAAQSLVRRSFKEPRETYEVNVLGTVNVLDAVRSQGSDVGVVLNVTSDKCYENREWEWGYREDEPMGGFDPYSSSKGCAELVANAFRRSFFADSGSPRLASVRAGNVIGGGDWAEGRLIPDVMSAALEGTPIEVRHPDAIRPWQHVLNPLSGYLALAQAAWDEPAYATAFNFGPPDDDARPVRWVVDRLIERWPDPVAWHLDTGAHPHEATYLKLDSTRARDRLGWTPGWHLGEALDAIVEWYLALRDGRELRDATLEQIRAFPPGMTP